MLRNLSFTSIEIESPEMIEYRKNKLEQAKVLIDKKKEKKEKREPGDEQ